MTAPRVRSLGALRKVLAKQAPAVARRALEEALLKAGAAPVATPRTRNQVLAALGLPAGPRIANRP